MGQQRAAQHQPAAAQQHRAMAIQQGPAVLPVRLRAWLQPSHQGAAAQAWRRAAGVRQGQQAAAEVIHLGLALPELATAQRVIPGSSELSVCIEAMDPARKRHEPAAPA